MADNIELDEQNINLVMDDESAGLTLDDFGGEGKFVNEPRNVGEEIIFTVLKVHPINKNTTVTKKDGTTFEKGLKFSKEKNKQALRYDIDTDLGEFTPSSWEIFFKLFDKRKGSEGVLTKYALTHNKHYENAKLSIKRLVATGHLNYNNNDLLTILGTKDLNVVIKYKEGLQKAKDEKRLFEVKLLN